MNEAKIDLSEMITEMRNPSTMELDTMSSLEIVSEMNREDALIPQPSLLSVSTVCSVVSPASASLRSSSHGTGFLSSAWTAPSQDR